MLYLTRMTHGSKTPLIVGKFFDDSVLARTPDGSLLRVPRQDIETPVLCCNECLQPMISKREKNTGKEYVECPNHAQHMFNTLDQASNNKKDYNHNRRRQFHKQAGQWLNKWKHLTSARLKGNQPLVSGKLIAEQSYIAKHFERFAAFTDVTNKYRESQLCSTN